MRRISLSTRRLSPFDMLEGEFPQIFEAPFCHCIVSIDREFLPRIAQLLQSLRETQRAEFARARGMVEVYDLGHKGLICASLLQNAPVPCRN